MEKNKKYVIALDEGTTSCRAVLYDKDAHALDSRQMEFTQIFPKPGWVEHNAEEIFKTQLKVLQNLIVDNDIIVGYVTNNIDGKMQVTTAFKILYTDKGTHIVPTYESQKAYWKERREQDGTDWLLRQKS